MNAPWWRTVGPGPWRTLAAAGAGWMLDAMDVMLFTFALNAIRDQFSLSGALAGSLASISLLASAAGGILFGFLADRYGRTRALCWSILLYSGATALTATSRSAGQMLVWRLLLGLGLGGEWSAGAVLVAETWPAEHRGKAIGLMQSGWAVGYLLAALLAGLVLPRWGWRVLFAAGVAPALLVFWIQRRIPEPASWRGGRTRRVARLWTPAIRGRLAAATLLTACVLFAYWGLFTWLPAYLGAPREQGGAGLTLLKTSAWMVPVQLGAFLGYVSFGFLADRWGRRPVFAGFVVCAAVLAPIYGAAARWPTGLLLLGPALGYFGHGYFSVFGALLAELFPAEIRATAQGLCYNAGRAVAALAPPSIGALADRYGIGAALGLTSAFFLAGAALVWRLPETRAAELT
jgi:MFS family permease